jgi:prepilin-type N-terminal cleavage/methylation domain-containing protein
MIKLQNNKGFTIIELMIASMVFSIVLILCVSGMIQIGRMYYKGVTTSRTQETARTILDSVSQAIQFSGGSITPLVASADGDANQYSFCVNTKRFSVYKGRQVVDSGAVTADQARHALVVDDVSTGCPAPQDLNDPNLNPPGGAAPALTATSRELIPAGLRISNILITADTANKLYTVTVRVVSGDSDLLDNANATNATCKVQRQGSQFCAVSELSTVVQKRL